jgi:hypothetical protein
MFCKGGGFPIFGKGEDGVRFNVIARFHPRGADGHTRNRISNCNESKSAEQSGTVLAGRCLKLDSGYGTTATIASATAVLAIQGLPTSGAGHLSQFISLDTLMNHPIAKPHLING